MVASEKGGLPPTTEAAYDDPKVKKALPFADLLRESIEDGGPRPVSPAYSDISLAIQKTYHPPTDVSPDGIEDKLQRRMSGRPKVRSSDERRRHHRKRRVTDRARSERGSPTCCAPRR